MKRILMLGFLSTSLFVTSFANAAVDAEVAYIFNSFSFLVHGFLVMLMAAGFCMLETGLVRAKNAVVQCAKNIGLYSIAGIMFAVVGYNLMYMDVSGWFLHDSKASNIKIKAVISCRKSFLYSVLQFNKLVLP